MAITSYSGLLTELVRLIDGEDVSASDIPSATLSQLVHMGELRIYRETRTRFNQKTWGITTTSNLATIPDDFQEAGIVFFETAALKPVSEEWLLEYLATNPTGPALYFAKKGNSFKFAPPVTDGMTVDGRYYCSLPDLDETTLPDNALFAVAEDLFLYAALAESAPFFGQDARLPMWEAKYQAIRTRLNLSENYAAMGAGRIVRKPSTRLMR